MQAYPYAIVVEMVIVGTESLEIIIPMTILPVQVGHMPIMVAFANAIEVTYEIPTNSPPDRLLLRHTSPSLLGVQW